MCTPSCSMPWGWRNSRSLPAEKFWLNPPTRFKMASFDTQRLEPC